MFLSVTSADTDSVDYENIAFETNNFLVPVCFCLVSQEQFRGYSEQLMQALSKIQPHRGSGWVGILFQGIPMADSMGGCCRAIALEGTFPFVFRSCIWVAGNLIAPCIGVFYCRYLSGFFAIFLVHWQSCPLSERHSRMRYSLAVASSLSIQPITSICWIGRDFHVENVR